jgi:hypothetical protein
MLLHCCYTVFTLLLHCCYTAVALLLQVVGFDDVVALGDAKRLLQEVCIPPPPIPSPPSSSLPFPDWGIHEKAQFICRASADLM